MTPTTPQPSAEQQAIMDAGKAGKNLMIKSYAGTGKTTTLVMLANAMSIRPSLALAFNRKIKEELEKKLPSHFDTKTMNGLGHVAFGKSIGRRCSVNEKKITEILHRLTLPLRRAGEFSQETFTNILQLVRKARAAGLVPKGLSFQGLVPDYFASWESIADELYMDITTEHVDLARKVLLESIRIAFEGELDYDDQIYMSALFGGNFPKYPVVLVDEAQDLSPLQHIMLKKVALGQLIVVGDPRQAIYAFRGADSSSMENLRKLREEWVDLSLTTTYRCPKVVVARQQEHAPGYNAATEAPEGEELNLLGKAWKIKDFDGTLAILCRNNAPLLAAAMRILKQGIGCTVMGREIGKGLQKLAKDLGEQDSLKAMEKLSSWADREAALAVANQKEEKVALIRDKQECLAVVLEQTQTVAEALQLLDLMFSKDNVRITLATGHKAKGLEWTTVIHLDPWRIPSKFAKQALDNGNPIPMEQDLNLKYVIETRTQKRFILAELEFMDAQ